MLKFIKGLFKKPAPLSEFRKKVEQHRQSHKELKQKWDQARMAASHKIVGLQEVHVSEAGNIYYIHTNILDIVFVRYMAMLKALQKVEFNLTLPELKKSLTYIRNANKKNDQQRIYKECDDIELRWTRLPQKRSILELAMCVIYRHDENPYIHNAVTQSKKLEEMQNDPELEVFFCEQGWEIAKPYLGDSLGDFKQLSAADFLQELLNQKKREVIG